MARLKITDFNFDITKDLKRLIKIGGKRFPNRDWHLKVIYFQDSDFKLELRGGLIKTGVTDVLSFSKSENKIFHYKEKRFRRLYHNICGLTKEKEIKNEKD